MGRLCDRPNIMPMHDLGTENGQPWTRRIRRRNAPGHARPSLTLLLEIGDCRSAARRNREADAGRAVRGLTVGGEKAVP